MTNNNSKIFFHNYLKVTEGSGKKVCVQYVPNFIPKENTRYYVEETVIEGNPARVYEHAEAIVVEKLTQNGVKKIDRRGRPSKGNLEKIAMMVLAGKTLTTKNIAEVLKISKGSASMYLHNYRERYGKTALTNTRLSVYNLNEKQRERTEAIQKVWLQYNQDRDATARDAALAKIG